MRAAETIPLSTLSSHRRGNEKGDGSEQLNEQLGLFFDHGRLGLLSATFDTLLFCGGFRYIATSWEGRTIYFKGTEVQKVLVIIWGWAMVLRQLFGARCGLLGGRGFSCASRGRYADG